LIDYASLAKNQPVKIFRGQVKVFGRRVFIMMVILVTDTAFWSYDGLKVDSTLEASMTPKPSTSQFVGQHK